MSRLSLKLGLCTSTTTGYVDCAFEQSACDDPSDWRSPGVLLGNDLYRGMGDFCLLSGAVRQEVLGRCGGRGDGSGPGRGVGGRCAPNQESCQPANVGLFDERVPFETASPDCTVEETTFGKCGDRCSWSPADCGPDESWMFPAEECKCGDVRTGGCVRRDGLGILGDVYCAVSGGACDEKRGWEWMSPLEMAANAEVDAECYVCIGTAAPVPVERLGASIPVVGSEEGSQEGSSPSPSAAIGAAVGWSLLVALLASLLIARQFKKRQSKSAEAELQKKDSDATTVAFRASSRPRNCPVDTDEYIEEELGDSEEKKEATTTVEGPMLWVSVRDGEDESISLIEDVQSANASIRSIASELTQESLEVPEESSDAFHLSSSALNAIAAAKDVTAARRDWMQ